MLEIRRRMCDAIIHDERKSADSLEFLVVLLKTILFASVAEIYGSQGCTNAQVTWRSDSKAKNDTCLPCIDCPDGSQPSIPCGAVAKYGTHLHCVICEKGTYSDKYGKEQCKPCSLCSSGRTVARKCSARKNTACGHCRHGYYESKHVFDCLPCSICCGDGKDQIEEQCKAQGLPKHKHCQPRHDHINPCLSSKSAIRNDIFNVSTTLGLTEIISRKRKEPSKTNNSILTPGVPSISSQPGSRSHVQQSTSNAPPTVGQTKATTADVNVAFQRVKYSPSHNSSKNKTKVIITLAVCVSLLLLFTVVVKRRNIISFLGWLTCRQICQSKDAESGITECTLVDDLRTSKGVLLPLRELKSVSFESYDRVWKRLDRQPDDKKDRKGCFKEVARVFGFQEEDIWEFEKEFHTRGHGSPSRELLECLETKKPRLTVFEFIKILQLPEVNRNDIVDILNDFVFKKLEN